jgi:hypothetical protein
VSLHECWSQRLEQAVQRNRHDARVVANLLKLPCRKAFFGIVFGQGPDIATEILRAETVPDDQVFPVPVITTIFDETLHMIVQVDVGEPIVSRELATGEQERSTIAVVHDDVELVLAVEQRVGLGAYELADFQQGGRRDTMGFSDR